MRKRRVYHVLSLLQEEEIALFKGYLTSPLFDPDTVLIRFLDWWEEKGLLDQGIGTEEMSTTTFLANSGFHPSRLDKLCSQLYRKTVDFLALRRYQASQELQDACANEALAAKEASHTDINRQIERQEKRLAKTKDSSEKRQEALQLVWKKSEIKTRVRKTRALWKEDFKELHEKLDGYYYLQKLKALSASANIRNLYHHQEVFQAPFLDFFRESVPLTTCSYLEQAYYHTVEMLLHSEDQLHFEALIQLLKEKGESFAPEEERELYSYALNLTIRKGNKGDRVQQEYSALLYRELLEKGLLLIEGKLPSQAMKNIVVLHCRLGHLEWVESFIEAYQFRLTEEANPTYITYNRAVLAFFQANYSQAISHLKEVLALLKDDVFYELDARVYLWTSFYESYEELNREEVDEMDKMYDSFRILIGRNQKIAKAHKLQYQNFIRQFKRLIVFHQMQTPPRDQLEVFRGELTAVDNTFNRNWLLAKVDELLALA